MADMKSIEGESQPVNSKIYKSHHKFKELRYISISLLINGTSPLIRKQHTVSKRITYIIISKVDVTHVKKSHLHHAKDFFRVYRISIFNCFTDSLK